MNVFKREYRNVPTLQLEKFSNSGRYDCLGLEKSVKRVFAGRIAKVFKNK